MARGPRGAVGEDREADGRVVSRNVGDAAAQPPELAQDGHPWENRVAIGEAHDGRAPVVTCENDVVLHAHGLLLRLEDEQQTKGSTMTESTGETPVLDLLASMTADSVAASSLDPEALVLVRIAALAAVDAPAVSYLLNLAAATEVGINAEQVRGVLAAIAPIVGTARVASATGKIVDALDVAIEVAELEEQDEQDEV